MDRVQQLCSSELSANRGEIPYRLVFFGSDPHRHFAEMPSSLSPNIMLITLKSEIAAKSMTPDA